MTNYIQEARERLNSYLERKGIIGEIITTPVTPKGLTSLLAAAAMAYTPLQALAQQKTENPNSKAQTEEIQNSKNLRKLWNFVIKNYRNYEEYKANSENRTNINQISYDPVRGLVLKITQWGHSGDGSQMIPSFCLIDRNSNGNLDSEDIIYFSMKDTHPVRFDNNGLDPIYKWDGYSNKEKLRENYLSDDKYNEMLRYLDWDEK